MAYPPGRSPPAPPAVTPGPSDPTPPVPAGGPSGEDGGVTGSVPAATPAAPTGAASAPQSSAQTTAQPSIEQRIADELGVRRHQVASAVDLLDEGSTVPFVARYRKEATGGLDDAQLRTLEERLRYLRELEERRTAVLEEIRKQGKLTPELEQQVLAAESKARLEDVYLPYKPKRRTKAMIAREMGLEPLAEGLLADPSQDPQQLAATFVNADLGVTEAAAALEGARSILVEKFAEDADLIGSLRQRMWVKGRIVAKVREGKEAAGAKYSDY